jgi:hypothetical protein
MNGLHSTAILSAAFFTVFLESTLLGPRRSLGAQIDLLPSLMTYTALSSSLSTVALLAICGGLWFDSLSANPVGITIVPLFIAGATIHYQRAILLRDQWLTRSLLGLAATATVPPLTLIALLGAGHQPLLGWFSLWQWLVMAIAGAAATPLWFLLFNRLNHAIHYPPLSEPPFRPDRDIKRGR